MFKHKYRVVKIKGVQAESEWLRMTEELQDIYQVQRLTPRSSWFGLKKWEEWVVMREEVSFEDAEETVLWYEDRAPFQVARREALAAEPEIVGEYE